MKIKDWARGSSVRLITVELVEKIDEEEFYHEELGRYERVGTFKIADETGMFNLSAWNAMIDDLAGHVGEPIDILGGNVGEVRGKLVLESGGWKPASNSKWRHPSWNRPLP